jgi:chaperonin GroEL
MKEKKHRVEDALQATSAVSIGENGVSPDGSDDERTGARIVLRALEEPLRQLAENAGLEGSVVVNDVRKAKKGFGLHAATNEIVDLVAGAGGGGMPHISGMM